MVTRITAVFDERDSADAALRRIHNGVRGVYSTGFIRTKRSSDDHGLHGGSVCTMLPTASVGLDNMISNAVTIGHDEPQRSQKSSVYIVCDGSHVADIRSILTSFGGTDIYSPIG